MAWHDDDQGVGKSEDAGLAGGETIASMMDFGAELVVVKLFILTVYSSNNDKLRSVFNKSDINKSNRNRKCKVKCISINHCAV